MASLKTRSADQNSSINHGFFFAEAVIAVGCILGLMWQTAFATAFESAATSVGNETCLEDLDALVAFLKETAEVEGRLVRIERKADGVVLLRDEDFVQHMQCRNGELHIDVRDPH